MTKPTPSAHLLTYIAIIIALFISSCSLEEPKHYRTTEETYIITFAGDCEEFKGLISVSTISANSRLSSSSFENQIHNSFSDSHFKDLYELKLHSIANGKPKTAIIHCCALCFSEQDLSMKCSIYKLGMDTIITKEDIIFRSFPIGSRPTSNQYSFKIEL